MLLRLEMARDCEAKISSLSAPKSSSAFIMTRMRMVLIRTIPQFSFAFGFAKHHNNEKNGTRPPHGALKKL